MTSVPRDGERAVGIAVGPAELLAVVTTGAPGATVAPGSVTVAPAVHQHGDQLRAGAAEEPGAARTDVLDRLGGRELVAFHDTYYEPADMLAVLLAHLRRDAEGLAGGTLAAAAIAHPAHWDARRQGQLGRAARGAGFTDVELVSAPEAALHAPAAGPRPATAGLVLVLHLDRPGAADLVEPQGAGYRAVGSAVLSGQGRIRPVVDELLAVAGRSWAEVCEVRAFGRGAVDQVRVSAIENEVGGSVRVAERALDAVAVGALHRWMGRRASAPPPPTSPPPPRLPPDADITQLLAQHAADCDAAGDHGAAARARDLAQEIYQFRLRIHPPAPPGTEAAVLRAARALIATTPGGS